MDSRQANHGSGVALAERPKPAPAQDAPAEAPAPWLTIGQRLAAIRAEAFGIGKDNIQMSYTDKKTGNRKEFTIKGHTVEAVLSEIRPLLDDNGVDLWPNLIERTYNGNRCDVIVDWTFECLNEDPDGYPANERYTRRTIRWAGAGTDDGDKGFSKAGTNCLKEMLKKVFLITDRDDAREEVEAVEHKSAENISRADLERAQIQRRAAIEQWAKTFKSALEKADGAKDVERLQRENREQLDAEDLPAVTRTFFLELIASQKARFTRAAE